MKDNKSNGYGKELLPSGTSYEGEFKNDLKHGKGTYIWANGQKYEGDYKDG